MAKLEMDAEISVSVERDNMELTKYGIETSDIYIESYENGALIATESEREYSSIQFNTKEGLDTVIETLQEIRDK